MFDGKRFYGEAGVFGDLDRAVSVGVGEDQHELLAAVADDHIGGALHLALQRLGDADQAVVSLLVAVGVVEGFEVVHIEHDDRQRL